MCGVPAVHFNRLNGMCTTLGWQRLDGQRVVWEAGGAWRLEMRSEAPRRERPGGCAEEKQGSSTTRGRVLEVQVEEEGGRTSPLVFHGETDGGGWGVRWA